MAGKVCRVLLPIMCLTAVARAEVSDITAKTNQQVLEQLPFSNTEDFADASRGFIAPLPNQGVIKNEKGEVVWDLSLYQFLNPKQEDPNKPAPIPNSVNPSLWRQAQLLNMAGLFKVTERVYQVRGADLSNMTIIEGKEGIIIIDPLLSKETARVALDLYYQHRPKKPIKAVLYTHSHVDHFGGVKGVISQEDVDQGLVKVFAPQGFTEAALDENVMAGNVMGRRAGYMYGALISPGPQGQVSAGLGLTTSIGEMTLILPTDLIKHTGQEALIDGVKFVFLMAPGSEAPAEMLFYLPEFKALGAAEDATHTMHNLYTLRGAKIRDAKAWAKYLNEAIEMFGAQSEVVFAQHHWPVWGQSRVVDFLEKQRDMYKYLHDQTLRLANEGHSMTEIAELLKLPKSLSQEWYNRGYYGSLNHNAKSVYNFYLGWFNGNPSTLHPLPEIESSKKYVEYMGGAEAILKKAREDIQQGNYRFAAQVLNHVVFANPENKEAKELLANVLDQLGYQAENATWRNFYLTGAMELRHGVRPKGLAVPNSPDIISVMPMQTFLDYLAVRLNGPAAAETPMSINFNLPDRKEKYLIQIKNGVLNYFSDKNAEKADLTLTLNRSDLNALILGQVKPLDLIRDKKMTVQGSKLLLKKFTSLFDEFNPWFNLVEPLKAPTASVEKEDVNSQPS